MKRLYKADREQFVGMSKKEVVAWYEEHAEEYGLGELLYKESGHGVPQKILFGHRLMVCFDKHSRRVVYVL